MKPWLILSLLVAACAAPPVAQQPDYLFHDDLFQAPTEPISAREVFALSAEMKDYLNTVIARQLRAKGPHQGLIDALYSKQQLRLEYDASMTRNAAQAFAARTGNCLSLVIMTAAFAKEMELPVQYQNVFVEETWSRSGGLYFSSEHVNLSLGSRHTDTRSLRDENYLMTIDFLPQQEIRGQRARVIGEDIIIAMYMNNRAAETLANGQTNQAYWWAREAIRQAPRFLSAYNTLGVIYRRHSNLPEAEQILRQVLEREPDNTDVMSNLALVLHDLWRVEEAQLLARKLAQIQPHPPFHFFNLGLTAMHDGDFRTAKELFLKEVKRAAYYHEFHYWLASAYFSLGETRLASEHLHIAMENSATRTDHDLYAAKLDRIRSAQRSGQ
ncbi:MAG: tetratricopeptide repeat protein [Proteobacteria bacterium]|nr:tetratricopeptide repeat protein [Pseudomonadota bacterium]